MDFFFNASRTRVAVTTLVKAKKKKSGYKFQNIREKIIRTSMFSINKMRVMEIIKDRELQPLRRSEVFPPRDQGPSQSREQT